MDLFHLIYLPFPHPRQSVGLVRGIDQPDRALVLGQRAPAPALMCCRRARAASQVNFSPAARHYYQPQCQRNVQWCFPLQERRVCSCDRRKRFTSPTTRSRSARPLLVSPVVRSYGLRHPFVVDFPILRPMSCPPSEVSEWDAWSMAHASVVFK
jgi:hypothetical protein